MQRAIDFGAKIETTPQTTVDIILYFICIALFLHVDLNLQEQSALRRQI